MPCEAIVTGLPAATGARWHAAKFVLPRRGAVVEPLEICHGGFGVLDTSNAGHVVIPTASTGVIFATGSGPFHHLLTVGILREVQRTALRPPSRDLHGGTLAAQEVGPFQVILHI